MKIEIDDAEVGMLAEMLMLLSTFVLQYSWVMGIL